MPDMRRFTGLKSSDMHTEFLCSVNSMETTGRWCAVLIAPLAALEVGVDTAMVVVVAF